MRKPVHVHIHRGAAQAQTRDSEDGDGRWVTIDGAHVHINGAGKIDKGPAALVNKSEHQGHAQSHGDKATHHAATAKEKGKAHPDAKYHEAAAREHSNAEHQRALAHDAHVAGDHEKVKAHTAKAEAHAASAAEHERSLANSAPAGKTVTSVAPMPASHEKLHEEAGKTVAWSKKHKEEHNRLLNMYHSSTANWERSAVNRRIEHNAVAAEQSRAESLHGDAIKASDKANTSGDASHHAAALQHINSALDAHSRAGGVGYAAKQDELRKRAKGHESALNSGKTAALDKMAERKAMGKAHPGEYKAMEHKLHAQAHRAQARIYSGLGDKRAAKPHEDAAALHDHASMHYDGGGDDARGQQLSDKAHAASKATHPEWALTKEQAKPLRDLARGVAPKSGMHPNGTPLRTEGGRKISRPASATPEDDARRAAVRGAGGATLADEARAQGAPSPMKILANSDAAKHHRAQAEQHRKPVGQFAIPDEKMAALHDEKAAHHEAQAKGEDRSKEIADVSQRIAKHQATKY